MKKSVEEILEEYHKAPISTMTSDGTTYSIDQVLSDLSSLVLAELEALKKDRFLKKDKIEYQSGWVDGHKKAVDEAKEVIAKLIRGSNA